jgi:hypothetical protein
MNRDPNYYLDKAKYFNKIAEANGYDPKTGSIDDSEYEYIKIDPVKNKNNIMVKSIKQKISNIKPACKRYFDPVTKHYYRTEKIFEDNSDEYDDNENPSKMVQSNPDVWYPENKLSFKTMRDPDTGKFYRINKVYDKNGNYSYKYNKLNYQAQKKPGTNFYVPVYSLSKKNIYK